MVGGVSFRSEYSRVERLRWRALNSISPPSLRGGGKVMAFDSSAAARAGAAAAALARIPALAWRRVIIAAASK